MHRDISSINGVEALVAEPSPPLDDDELTPEMKRWREDLARMDARGERQALRFENVFNAAYGLACADCRRNRADQGHSRCRGCRRRRRKNEDLLREKHRRQLAREVQEARAER